MLDNFYRLPDSQRMLWVLVVGIGMGLVLGIFMQKASRDARPVRGGAPAQIFHYLASSTFSVMIPVIIIAIISKLPLLRIILSALTLSASTWVFLLLYAVFESQAKQAERPVVELD